MARSLGRASDAESARFLSDRRALALEQIPAEAANKTALAGWWTAHAAAVYRDHPLLVDRAGGAFQLADESLGGMTMTRKFKTLDVRPSSPKGSSHSLRFARIDQPERTRGFRLSHRFFLRP